MGGLNPEAQVLNTMIILEILEEPSRDHLVRYEIIVASTIGAITLCVVLGLVCLARR